MCKMHKANAYFAIVLLKRLVNELQNDENRLTETLGGQFDEKEKLESHQAADLETSSTVSDDFAGIYQYLYIFLHPHAGHSNCMEKLQL